MYLWSRFDSAGSFFWCFHVFVSVEGTGRAVRRKQSFVYLFIYYPSITCSVHRKSNTLYYTLYYSPNYRKHVCDVFNWVEVPSAFWIHFRFPVNTELAVTAPPTGCSVSKSERSSTELRLKESVCSVWVCSASGALCWWWSSLIYSHIWSSLSCVCVFMVNDSQSFTLAQFWVKAFYQ